MDLSHLFTGEAILSLVILIILEVVLGIDNVIFVSIIMDRLPQEKVPTARKIWMVTGITIRSILLFGLSWLLGQQGVSAFANIPVLKNIEFLQRFDLASLVMLAGGTFLIYKTVKEIHHKMEGDEDTANNKKTQKISLGNAIGQIMLIDMIFSFDSIITAGGTAKHIEVMIAAVIVAMVVMFLFSPRIAAFIHKHPTIKMLALSFLVMIGVALIVEGWDAKKAHDLHLKNYIYFAMAFSFSVELLNMRVRSKSKPVELRGPKLDNEDNTPEVYQ
jgi:predicted tellurium resistance membrane protein TerC